MFFGHEGIKIKGYVFFLVLSLVFYQCKEFYTNII